MYAVGALLGLIGAVKVYQKWNAGDQDTGKLQPPGLVAAFFWWWLQPLFNPSSVAFKKSGSMQSVLTEKVVGVYRPQQS